MVTLLDPSRLWASQVLRALSDATAAAAAAAEPARARHLAHAGGDRARAGAAARRRRAAGLPRRHPRQRDGGGPGAGGDRQRAGRRQPAHRGDRRRHAAACAGALLRSLLQATRQPGWRCPRLVFILPPGAAALRQRILEQPWPARVQAAAVAEPLACAASVWNCVLEAWEAAPPAPQPCAHPPSRQREFDPGLPQALSRLIAPLAAGEGVLACGIVTWTAAACSIHQGRTTPICPVWRWRCARRAGAPPSPARRPARRDPDHRRAAPRPCCARCPAMPGWASSHCSDRQQANLALLRFKLLEAERLLCWNNGLKPGRWRADKACIQPTCPRSPRCPSHRSTRHEKTIFDTVVATAPRYPALAGNADLLADVACVALNRVPPHHPPQHRPGLLHHRPRARGAAA